MNRDDQHSIELIELMMQTYQCAIQNLVLEILSTILTTAVIPYFHIYIHHLLQVHSLWAESLSQSKARLHINIT